jgi:hypothetical protein
MSQVIRFSLDFRRASACCGVWMAGRGKLLFHL